jgi:hypothetical protein
MPSLGEPTKKKKKGVVKYPKKENSYTGKISHA